MKQLTEQEFLAKYGDTLVTFTSYYKYNFLFEGQFEGRTITADVGGSPDDIYRFHVTMNPVLLKELSFAYARVWEGENVVEECNNSW